MLSMKKKKQKLNEKLRMGNNKSYLIEKLIDLYSLLNIFQSFLILSKMKR